MGTVIRYLSYICLFTCATTRNVHLEIMLSVSAQYLISCLKRFTGRRGRMNFSDNFQTFVSDKLKVMSATFLLVYFVCLKESTFEIRKNIFYFTSKALFVLEIIRL